MAPRKRLYGTDGEATNEEEKLERARRRAQLEAARQNMFEHQSVQQASTGAPGPAPEAIRTTVPVSTGLHLSTRM